MVVPFVIKEVKKRKLWGRSWYRLTLGNSLTKLTEGRIMVHEGMLKKIVHTHHFEELEKKKVDLENAIYSFGKETNLTLRNFDKEFSKALLTVKEKDDKKRLLSENNKKKDEYRKGREAQYKKLRSELDGVLKEIKESLDQRYLKGEYIKIKIGKKEAF